MKKINNTPKTNTPHKTWREIVTQNASDIPPYSTRITGQLPKGLNGVLYRNGPGMFERNGYRKKRLLDGEGYIQKYAIRDGKVTFTGALVETPKFVSEEKAGKFLYPTWTTLAPGGIVRNWFRSPKNQAGVTVWPQFQNLYAYDEVQIPARLNKDSLRFEGFDDLVERAHPIKYAAHAKYDPYAQQWLQFGVSYGRHTLLYMCAFKATGAVINIGKYKLPHPTYIHDWFFTPNYFIFLLHPVKISLAPMIVGLKSFVDAMTWHPDAGNTVLVFPRNGPYDTPQIFHTKANWMWHSINAYEEKNMIIMDFIGYDGPGEFLGDDAPLKLAMENKPAQWEPSGPVRYVLDLKKQTLAREVRGIWEGIAEFPMIRTRDAGMPYEQYFYIRGEDPNAYFTNTLVKKGLNEERI